MFLIASSAPSVELQVKLLLPTKYVSGTLCALQVLQPPQMEQAQMLADIAACLVKCKNLFSDIWECFAFQIKEGF